VTELTMRPLLRSTPLPVLSTSFFRLAGCETSAPLMSYPVAPNQQRTRADRHREVGRKLALFFSPRNHLQRNRIGELPAGCQKVRVSFYPLLL